ncbi:MAG: hypothetical protein FJ293_16910 [Planctomycetes bacterium]|nr:hypothetical protein [Planctomycetota bacterium]
MPVTLEIKTLVALVTTAAVVGVLVGRLSRPRGGDAAAPHVPPAEIPPGVADALARGEKIAAIAAYRKATGAGLKDAKDVVDELERGTKRK